MSRSVACLASPAASLPSKGQRYAKRTQQKYTKQHYRARNWREYEAGLRKRGDLTLWFSEEAIAAWRAPAGEKPGSQPVYSDLANDGQLHIMIDSTGLRVQSGNVPGSTPPKRRAWRKLHLVVDVDTGEVVASALGTHRARDAAQVPGLLAQMDHELASVMADGAYDLGWGAP